MRTSIVFALATLIPTAAAVAAAAPSSAPRQAMIGGALTDAETGGPVEGAQVLVLDTERGTLTPRSGRFLIRDVPAGRRLVVVEHPCYHRVAVEVEVTEEAALVLDIGLPFKNELRDQRMPLGACPR